MEEQTNPVLELPYSYNVNITNENDWIEEDDDSSSHSNYDENEIYEVEIHPEELDELMQELKEIKGLSTEITCAEDDVEEDDIFGNIDEIKDDIQNDEAGLDDHYDNYDTEEFSTTFTDEFFNVPVVKTEEIENIDQLKAKSLVKLFKLDQFLLDKLITAEKGFLRTRFLTSIVSKQEQAEKAIGINEPVELKNGSFMCHLCLKVYKSRNLVDRHIQVFHNRSRLSKCDRCDYVGSSAGALTRHIQVVHLNMLKFQCEKCEFKTMKRSDIVKHMIDKHDIAEEIALTLIQPKTNLKNEEGEEQQQPSCDYCNFKTTSKCNLTKHIKRKHKDRDIDPETVCRLCQEVFPDKLANLRHSCQVRLQAKEALKDIEYNDMGKILCPGCSNEFNLMIKLRNHYLEVHVNLKKNSKKIPKEEIKEEEYNNVMFRERSDGSYLCDQCPFIGSKEDLTWHCKQLHKDRNFKCDNCLFSTNSKDVLSNHVKRVHEGIASQFCQLCSMVCWNLKELGEHLKEIHYEQTKHLFCSQPACEFWARQKNKLDKHVQRVHLRQKNFLCEKCDFRGFIQAELDVHVREKHLKIFRFNCHLCHRESIRMGFATKKRLYRHMAFAHNVDPALEDNEANRDLILNPPPLVNLQNVAAGLDGADVGGHQDVAVVGSLKKSKRGRRKGAKNRLKLDPDTGQLVRTLIKRPRKQCPNSTKSTTSNNSKKFRENNISTTNSSSTFISTAVSNTTAAAAFLRPLQPPPATAVVGAMPILSNTSNASAAAAAVATEMAAESILLTDHASLWSAAMASWPSSSAGTIVTQSVFPGI